MVAVGEGKDGVAVFVATLGVTEGVADGLGGLDELPSKVPMTKPTIAAGTRSATRTDRWPILVPDLCSVTDLL